MSEQPQTEAGRELLEAVELPSMESTVNRASLAVVLKADIPRIEREAVAAWLASPEAVEEVVGIPGVAVSAPHVPAIEHEDGCAYAYGNLTYPCRCLVLRSAILAALRDQRGASER